MTINRQILITIVSGVLFHLANQMFHSLSSHLCSVVPVKGSGLSPLLHVAQHVHAAREGALTLLTEQLVDEVRRVVGVGILISTQAGIRTEQLDMYVDVFHVKCFYIYSHTRPYAML